MSAAGRHPASELKEGQHESSIEDLGGGPSRARRRGGALRNPVTGATIATLTMSWVFDLHRLIH
jgi:hypothetical protein